MDSILTSVKKMLGITEEYKHFDPDLIMHINSVFTILWQLGVGPAKGFSISDAEATWDDFEISEVDQLEMVKSYMYAKVRLIFDPPTSGIVMESLKRITDEFEWRMNVAVDPTPAEE